MKGKIHVFFTCIYVKFKLYCCIPRQKFLINLMNNRI